MGLYCAQVVAPPISTKGKQKNQKPGQGKYISHARIHVELTCDFSPIYYSEGHYYDHTSKKTFEMISYNWLSVYWFTVCSALFHSDV